MKKAINVVWIVVLLVFDQIIKAVIASNYEVGQGFDVIKDVLEIQYIKNTGAAWGMMQGGTVFFAIFASIITAVLFYVLYKLPGDKCYIYLNVTLIFLIAGAIGNLIDRLTRGFVVDFIYFSLIDFPVFNIADIYITLSGIALVVLILFYYKDEQFEFLKIKR